LAHARDTTIIAGSAEHQAFDTVNQVKEILAGRMPPGAANAAAAHRLSVFGIS
jgi:D-3-phosphoglycerate dehydrogenase